MTRFSPEGGRLLLAEALFDEYKYLIRCPNCTGTPGQAGFIKDQAGKSSDGLPRRQWACQRSNGTKVSLKARCQRATCERFIAAARQQLNPSAFNRTLKAVLATLGKDSSFVQSLESYAIEQGSTRSGIIPPTVVPTPPVLPTVIPTPPVLPAVIPTPPVLPTVIATSPILPPITTISPILPAITTTSPILPTITTAPPVSPTVTTAPPVSSTVTTTSLTTPTSSSPSLTLIPSTPEPSLAPVSTITTLITPTPLSPPPTSSSPPSNPAVPTTQSLKRKKATLDPITPQHKIQRLNTDLGNSSVLHRSRRESLLQQRLERTVNLLKTSLGQLNSLEALFASYKRTWREIGNLEETAILDLDVEQTFEIQVKRSPADQLNSSPTPEEFKSRRRHRRQKRKPVVAPTPSFECAVFQRWLGGSASSI